MTTGFTHAAPAMKPREGGRCWKTITDLLVISAVWLLATGLANPVGNFPLNDDWAWGLTAKRLAEGQGYHPTDWTEMTLFSHAVWGALFCLPGGFSFTALRVSTLVLSLAGTLGLYGLLRQLTPSRTVALLGGFTLAFNPIYFALANTFMADVPFTAWAIFSTWGFAQFLQSGDRRALWIGTGFAVIATLCRQMGLCLPLGFLAAVWFRAGRGACWKEWRAAIPLLFCGGVLVGFQFWLNAADKVPPNTLRTERLWNALAQPQRIPVNIIYYGWGMLMYLGWFLLPLTIRGLATRNRPTPVWTARLAWGGVVLFGLVSAVGLLTRAHAMPVHNNIIANFGIGPATTRDIFDLALPHLPGLPLGFWVMVTGLSLGGAMLLVFQLVQFVSLVLLRKDSEWPEEKRAVVVFLLVAALAYLGPFLMSGYFDRYLLPVLAFLLAVMAVGLREDERATSPWRLWCGVGLIVVMGGFALAGTRDYLEWNRIRWRCARNLMEQKGVLADDIDGGFEFNRWHLYVNSPLDIRWESPRNHVRWADGAAYAITFGEIDGFETVERRQYRRWLPPREEQILVVRRPSNP